MELGRNARILSFGPPQNRPWILPIIGLHQSSFGTPINDLKSKDTIANSKAELVDWQKRFEGDWEFVRWPVRTSKAQEFVQRWNEAFGPLRTWLGDAALCVAAEVQRDFRDFRVGRGLVTYADQVALADELLQHPIAGRRLREEGFRVILDQAQDTDPDAIFDSDRDHTTARCGWTVG